MGGSTDGEKKIGLVVGYGSEEERYDGGIRKNCQLSIGDGQLSTGLGVCGCGLFSFFDDGVGAYDFWVVGVGDGDGGDFDAEAEAVASSVLGIFLFV